jgi:hypothetical protein
MPPVLHIVHACVLLVRYGVDSAAGPAHVQAAGLSSDSDEEVTSNEAYTPIQDLTTAWRRLRQAVVDRLHTRILSIENAFAQAELTRQIERDKQVAARAGNHILEHLHGKVTSSTARMVAGAKASMGKQCVQDGLAMKGMFGESSSIAWQLATQAAQKQGLKLDGGQGGTSGAAGGSPTSGHSQAKMGGLAALVHLQNPLTRFQPLTTVVARAFVGPAHSTAVANRPVTASGFIDLDDSSDDDAMQGIQPAKYAVSASGSAPGSSPEGTAAHALAGRQQQGSPAVPDIGTIIDAMQTLTEEYEKRDAALRDIARKGSDAASRRISELRARQKAVADSRKLVNKKGKLLNTGALEEEEEQEEGDGSDEEGQLRGEDGPVDEESTTTLLGDYLPPLLKDMVSMGEGLGTTSAGTAASALLQAFATGRSVTGMTAHTAASMLQLGSSSLARSQRQLHPHRAKEGWASGAGKAAVPAASHQAGHQAGSNATPATSHPRFMMRQSSLGGLEVDELGEEGEDSTPMPKGQGHGHRAGALATFASGKHEDCQVSVARARDAAPIHALSKQGAVNVLAGSSTGRNGPRVSSDQQRKLIFSIMGAASRRMEGQLEARKRGFRDQISLGLEKARRTLREEFSALSTQLAATLEAAGGQEAAQAYLAKRTQHRAAASTAGPLRASAAPLVEAPTAAALAAPDAPSAASAVPHVVRTYGKAGAVLPASVQAPTVPRGVALEYRVNDEGEGEYVEVAVVSGADTATATTATTTGPSAQALPLGQLSLGRPQVDVGMEEDDFAAAEDDAAVAVTVARSSEEVLEAETRAYALRREELVQAVAAAHASVPDSQAQLPDAPGPEAAARGPSSTVPTGKGKLGAMFAKQASNAASGARTGVPSVHTAANTHVEGHMDDDASDASAEGEESALARAMQAERDAEIEDEEQEEAAVVQPRFRRLKKGTGSEDDVHSHESSDAEDDASPMDEAEAQDGGSDASDSPVRPQTRAILDEDDEEYEAKRLAEEEARERLERPQTYADMIRAEAEADRKKKTGTYIPCRPLYHLCRAAAGSWLMLLYDMGLCLRMSTHSLTHSYPCRQG